MNETTASPVCDCGCHEHYGRFTRIGQSRVGTVPCTLCGNFVVHTTMSAHQASISCVPSA